MNEDEFGPEGPGWEQQQDSEERQQQEEQSHGAENR